MDNFIGRLLDNRYEIIEQVGIGGMAVVYKARDHRLKRLVAVKILKDDLAQNDEFRRRFNAESQAVAMLSHPNIVSVYDVSEYDGVNFIVMELIDGITLKQYMARRGMLNWRETLHFSTQISKALEHAHGRGIIHRDIKPHNIMILKDGSVKVADFGIARVSSSQHTLTREALGSVHYISPEQAKGGKTDCRSDIYSLGVVMYEMMTGKPPYDGESPVSVAIQHINGKAVMPRTINSDIPVGLEQIIMHAMSADLGARYDTAYDLLADLDEFRKNPEIVFSFIPSAAVGLTSETEIKQKTVDGLSKAAKAAAKKTDPRKKTVKSNEDDEKDNRKLILWIAIAAIGLLILLAVLFFTLLLPKLLNNDTKLTIPNFIGETADRIFPSDYPKFEFETKVEYDPIAEKGTVIAQSPEPNSSCDEGQLIILTISRGPKTNKMEDLRGKTVEEAEDILDSMELKQLTITLEYIESAEYENGRIVMTDPVEGVVLESGQKVKLYVSLGFAEELVELKTVPKLVGYSIDSATALLANAKLEIGTITEVPNDALKGTVLDQSLMEGSTAQVGTKVNLTVSLGPAESSDETNDQAGNTQPGSATTGNGSSQNSSDSQTEVPKTANITVIISLGIDPDKVPGDTYVLAYYLDDVMQGTPEEIPCFNDDVPVTEIRYTVTITGTQKLTVYKIHDNGTSSCIWSQYYTAE